MLERSAALSLPVQPSIHAFTLSSVCIVVVFFAALVFAIAEVVSQYTGPVLGLVAGFVVVGCCCWALLRRSFGASPSDLESPIRLKPGKGFMFTTGAVVREAEDGTPVVILPPNPPDPPDPDTIVGE
jgi:hypothetical protein